MVGGRWGAREKASGLCDPGDIEVSPVGVSIPEPATSGETPWLLVNRVRVNVAGHDAGAHRVSSIRLRHARRTKKRGLLRAPFALILPDVRNTTSTPSG